MILNRHLSRIKVFQSIYAYLLKGKNNVTSEKKDLKKRLLEIQDGYYAIIALLIELVNLAKKDTKRQNAHFLRENEVFNLITTSRDLEQKIFDHKIKIWIKNPDAIHTLYKEIFKDDDYFQCEKNKRPIDFFEILAHLKYLEEVMINEYIGWLDDRPYVNTAIKTFLLKIYKDKCIPTYDSSNEMANSQFCFDLFDKTTFNFSKLIAHLNGKIPNWELDRISKIDQIIICMGLSELFFFTEIPKRVVLNEYIDLAKDYSGTKGGNFINGILNNFIE